MSFRVFPLNGPTEANDNMQRAFFVENLKLWSSYSSALNAAPGPAAAVTTHLIHAYHRQTVRHIFKSCVGDDSDATLYK